MIIGDTLSNTIRVYELVSSSKDRRSISQYFGSASWCFTKSSWSTLIRYPYSYPCLIIVIGYLVQQIYNVFCCIGELLQSVVTFVERDQRRFVIWPQLCWIFLSSCSEDLHVARLPAFLLLAVVCVSVEHLSVLVWSHVSLHDYVSKVVLLHLVFKLAPGDNLLYDR